MQNINGKFIMTLLNPLTLSMQTSNFSSLFNPIERERFLDQKNFRAIESAHRRNRQKSNRRKH